MKKFFSSLFLLFLFVSCSALEGIFPGQKLLNATRQKLGLATSCLVDNAWKIAGTACFATASVATSIIIKNSIEDCRLAPTITPLIARNALRMLLPAGCSILGLLCFNINKNLTKKNTQIIDYSKVDEFLELLDEVVPDTPIDDINIQE